MKMEFMVVGDIKTESIRRIGDHRVYLGLRVAESTMSDQGLEVYNHHEITLYLPPRFAKQIVGYIEDSLNGPLLGSNSHLASR